MLIYILDGCLGIADGFVCEGSSHSDPRSAVLRIVRYERVLDIHSSSVFRLAGTLLYISTCVLFLLSFMLE